MTGRDPRVDFFRGLALLIIFCNHIPSNPLTHLTPSRWGYSDMAEVFVFLSGYVCGIAYTRRIARDGYLLTARRGLSRSVQLYAAFVFTMAARQLLVAAVEGGGSDALLAAATDHVADFLLLRYADGDLAILLVYMLCLLTIVPVLWLTERRPATLVCLSAFGWLVAWFSDQSIAAGQTWRAAWYYHPLAWQLLFFLGVSVGRSRVPTVHTTGSRSNEGPPSQRWLKTVIFAIAVLILEAAFLWQLFADGQTFPGGSKPLLGPTRLLHFAALLVVTRQLLPAGSTIFDHPLSAAISRCGRYPLTIFCCGSVLSLGAAMILKQSPHLITAVFLTIAGWIVLVLIAYLREQSQRSP